MVYKRSMNERDISGILMTYSAIAARTTNTESLKDIIRELKAELDLRKVKHSSEYED